jgi:lipoprotein-anchoring transpeptidase ErfK/SrfK
MVKYFTLAFTFTLLLFAISFSPNLPRYLSFSKNIDPNNLVELSDPTDTIAVFNNEQLTVPNITSVMRGSVLGDSTIPKRIEVDLTNQRLYGYEGDRLIYNFLISSGKWDRTPTGTFQIWAKIPSQKMEGGSKELGTYYYLPKVPYVMFFYNEKVKKQLGYSLHGTYWHNKFGQPMSHGCINMKTEEVAQIYAWADKSTPITIYGKYIYPVSIKTTKPQT